MEYINTITEADEARPKGKVRVAFLDGIRGWAALIVVFSHLMGGVLALENAEFVSQPYFHFLTNGHLSVLIFFVLSGYVLSISQIQSTKGNLPLAVVSRYFRLAIPVLFFAILAYIFMSFGLFFNVKASIENAWLGGFYVFEPSLYNALKFSIYDVFFNYDPNITYNSSAWTMPIELAGSMLIYAFIGIFKPQIKTLHIPSVIFTIFLYFNSPYMFCFMTGYLLAILKIRIHDINIKWFNFIILLCFISVIYIDTYHRPVEENLQALEAIAIIFCASYSKTLKKFFESKVSLFLGEISFPLYLVQIIVICSWSSFLRIYFIANEITGFASMFGILSSSLVICIALSKLFIPVDKYSVIYSKKIASKLLM
ncbi:acyltransferase [Enterobacter bugandensis]|uniref:acyltransferase family protein n=1 Tax=Enterobacter bugandensis TaxID=881260 RepID=UPI002005E2BF|nr:acyltransferase [Enterobacter bugandensis]MCK6732985.1 acyltransferase [Enterobacter bugandensis]